MGGRDIRNYRICSNFDSFKEFINYFCNPSDLVRFETIGDNAIFGEFNSKLFLEKHIMRTILKSLLFSVILFASSGASAQFQQYQQIASFRQNVGTYFLNENYGFVFTIGKISQYRPGYPNIVTDTIAIYRTTDGGTTWGSMDLGNSDLKNHWGLIYSMYFVSPSHGYMSASPITMDSVIPGVTSIGTSKLDTCGRDLSYVR